MLLFRRETESDEYDIAKTISPTRVVQYPTEIPNNTKVIGRYSVLPFYRWIEQSLNVINSTLINSYEDHLHIANFDYYHQITDLTPKTWFEPGYMTVPETANGWVVKGRTNSKKFQWNRLMYCNDRQSLQQIMTSLLDDEMIKQQGLIVREYVPLEVFEEGINGLQFTNEWRFFCLNGQILDYGFYWSSCEQADQINQQDVPKQAIDLVQTVCNRVQVPFMAVDIARTKQGEWIVIEINDGQMSGLSCIDPYSFYNKLL